MGIILGIDTGGTYTDGVLLDKKRGQVLGKSKALTTREDLATGISKCLAGLDLSRSGEIELVCLSTTLATNAVVEGKGSKAGLVIMNPAAEGQSFPADPICFLKGKLDIKGNEIEATDPQEIEDALAAMKGKAEAVAVSGYASVRNPSQELFVKKKAAEILGVPVVCGHELTRSLGYRERTVTAVLNARLIAVIQQLVDKTKAMLKEWGIAAPVVIVKGDGHFMADSFAEGRPIETVLSGPAASVMGACFLTDIRDGMVVDIGGTTTDIACISHGEAPLNEEGARVGDWQTRAKAMDIQTFGIGGDSCLALGKKELFFGPERAEPLCAAAAKAPHLTEELKSIGRQESWRVGEIQPFDCFRLLNPPSGGYLTDQDRAVLKLLKDGAHSAIWIGEKIGRKPKYLRLDKLMKSGCVQKISLTPTDLLHAGGKYVKWEKEASQQGVRIAAAQMGMELGEFLKNAKEQFVSQLSFALVKSMLLFGDRENENLDDEFLRRAIGGKLGGDLSLKISLNQTVIGVGAPAGAWLPQVCEKLSAPLILPENGDVANAVGAAAGNIQESVEALIKYSQETLKYVVYGPWGKDEFVTIEEAKEWAGRKIRELSMKMAEETGLSDCTVHIAEILEYEDRKNLSQWRLMELRMRGLMEGQLCLKKE